MADDSFTTFNLTNDPERFQQVGVIVDREFPGATRVVRLQILSYADGNHGCANMLARLCRKECCITAEEVTKLVGWKLEPTELRQEAGWQLYLRLKSGYLS